MSRNNLIAVVHYNNRYYVLANLNADTEWNREYCVERIGRGGVQYKSKRAWALLRAHNIQNRMDTEYGVREL